MLIKRALIVAVAAFLLLSCRAGELKRYNRSGSAMGTSLTVIFFTDDSKRANEIMDELFILADDLENRLSTKKAESILSELNSKRELVIKDKVVLETIKESIELAKVTDGRFDPSLYHLIKLWDIENNSAVPGEEAIKDRLSHRGVEGIIIDGNHVRLENNIKLDLGAIAKGKIIDELARRLQERYHIDNFLINGGGDIRLGGRYGGLRKWKVAVADPYNNGEIIGLIELENCSIVTSGNYERYFIDEKGDRYHHIIDPETGYPSQSGVDSVTVISDSTSRSDALATALFIMGSEAGLAFAEKQKDTEAIFITKVDNKIEIKQTERIKSTLNNEKKWNFTLE